VGQIANIKSKTKRNGKNTVQLDMIYRGWEQCILLLGLKKKLFAMCLWEKQYLPWDNFGILKLIGGRTSILRLDCIVNLQHYP